MFNNISFSDSDQSDFAADNSVMATYKDSFQNHHSEKQTSFLLKIILDNLKSKMHLEINDNTLLENVQHAFTNFYPYLTIEFYKGHHHIYETSDETARIDSRKKVSDVLNTHISTLIEIQPWYKVKDVENEFQERLGISVQIMKKEKENWEQTTGLDNITLRDLNILGRNSSDEYIVTDYDETFDEEFIG